jgi:hypothetical protein
MYQHELSSKDKIELCAFLWGHISQVSPPRFFRKPITICTGDDKIAFSPALAERVQLLLKVSLAGVWRHTLLVADWKVGSGVAIYGDTGDKTDDKLLDNITV